MRPDQMFDICKVHPANETPYYKVPVKIWEKIVKRESRRKMKLELDFTEHAKQSQKILGDYEPHDWRFPKTEKAALKTILKLDFPNGEPYGPGEVHPDPSNGRKAAKRLRKYIRCDYLDKTKK